MCCVCYCGVVGTNAYTRQRSQVHVYSCAEGEWTGEPAETEEMRPLWFETSAVPFEKMWKDDPYWFPLMVSVCWRVIVCVLACVSVCWCVRVSVC